MALTQRDAMTDDRILSNRLRDAMPIFTALAMALLTLIAFATLYFGRDVFMPLALAILLSFVLAPVVRLVQRLHVPRGLAVMGVVLLAFLVLFGLGTILAGQVAQLAGDLPRYQSTMREKIRSIRGTPGEAGTLERAADILQDLGRELERPGRETRPVTPSGRLATNAPEERPIPVEVREPDVGPLRTLGHLIAPLMHPLATTGMIVIFVVFILIQREDLRNRMIRLAGTHDLQKTTAAIDDAAQRLSRLFLTQVALNAGFGLVIGLGLWIIGVPSPVLWGILSAVLRFVPYIGAIISAAFPLALAAAVDPGWSMLLWTALLFLVVEPIVGHVIEPLVYGHSTGLSPVAVVLSATIWTFLWGPIGLVLATPLTVCLVVLGRHTERLQFIDVMLGDRPALSPPQIFYQRMLAGDPTEAVEQADEFLKERALSTYYDEVALEGLRLAHDDVARGILDAERQAVIREAVRELVDELASEDDATPVVGVTLDAEAAAAVEASGDDRPVVDIHLGPADLAPEWRSDVPVLCIPGRSPLDESAALMLGQLLSKHGIRARVLGHDALQTENLFRLDSAGVAMICLSYMDAISTVHIRYAVRRVRRKAPDARVLVGIWRDRDPETLKNLRRQTHADIFVTSLRDALAAVVDAARGVDVQPSEPASESPPLLRNRA
jgi:predicted PurR-regulated permease PerM